MFNNHLIIDNDGIKSLYLFIDFSYEFGSDLKTKNKDVKTKSLYDKVINYIKDNKIDFKMGKVFLVVGSLVIGSLFINNYKFSNLKNTLEPNYKYVEQVDIFGDEEGIFKPPVQENITENKQETSNNETVTEIIKPNNQLAIPNTTVPKTSNSTNVTTPTTPPPTNPAPQAPSTPQTTTPVAPPVQESQPTPPAPEPTPPPAPAETMVTLYRSIGIIETMTLEDYVVGVVGGEMPASFNSEALKAQSVLARTYAIKKLDSGQILKDDVSHQVYKDNNQLKALWGSSFQTYYNKVKAAVTATKGQTITYNGNYIEAVYHSTSNGMTEDSVTVWGNNYAYLKPVDSHWDLNASSYLRETEKEFSILSSIIGINFNEGTKIEILSRTTGNRVDKIQIDDKVFTGIELRNLLGLRSADFDIKIENGKTIFVTRGYGHGVGMSQYGANGMANEGYSYRQILAHYYPNTNLKS